MENSTTDQAFSPADADDVSNERLKKDSAVLSEQLRQWWVLKVIERIERKLIEKQITPNQITLATSFFSFVTGCLYASGYILISGWLVLLLGSLDILDGRVARSTGTERPSGAFLDSVMDRYQDFFLLGGLAFFFRDQFLPLLFVLAAILGSMTVSYARARAENLNIQLEKVGLMQRPERIFVLGVGSVFSAIFQIAMRPFLGRGDIGYYGLILVVFILAVAVNQTAIARILKTMKVLQAEYDEAANSEDSDPSDAEKKLDPSQ